MTAMLRHYRKDLLRPGTFLDERGRIVKYTTEHVLAAALSTNEAIADGVRIPVVVGDVHPTDIHESTPDLEKRPDVKGFLDLAAYQAGWLKADIDARDGVLPDTDTSVWIEPAVEVNGKRYAPFIRHVLLTDEPAVKGQAPMALLRSPKGDQKRASILTSHVGSDTPKEKVMNETKLLGSIRAKLRLPAEADEAAILADIEKLSAPPPAPALLSSVRTKLGLAPDSKDEQVLAKLDELAKAGAPPAAEPAIPAAMLKRQQELDSLATRLARKEFHHAIDAIGPGATMRIPPVTVDKIKKRFPIETTDGALLAAAKPMIEEELHRFILDLLNDLPGKNVLSSGAKLRMVGGNGEDREKRAKEEADKTLAAAGMEVK